MKDCLIMFEEAFNYYKNNCYDFMGESDMRLMAERDVEHELELYEVIEKEENKNG